MKYYTFNEFFFSSIASACGINNLPSADQVQSVRDNIKLLVDNVLDPIREYVKAPIYINSGYRSEALNDLVSGAKNSQHLIGRAADFTIRGFTPRDYKSLAFWCADNLEFDQMIVYAKRGFIHVSYVSPEANRLDVLFT